MIKKYLINFITRHFFKGLTEEDIFQYRMGKLYINNVLVEERVADKYREDATKMLHSTITQEIDKKIIFEANKLMFEKSRTADDMMFGKAILYSIELRKKYLEKIANIKN